VGADFRALLPEQRVAAGLVGVIVRVEQGVHTRAAEARAHTMGERRGSAIDEHDCVAGGQRDHIAWRAGDEGDPIREFFARERSLRPGGCLLASHQAQHGEPLQEIAAVDRHHIRPRR
jgi:hypothetical protein